MKKDFDFDNIGKRTPYTTPDGFFEDVQLLSTANVFEEDDLTSSI